MRLIPLLLIVFTSIFGLSAFATPPPALGKAIAEAVKAKSLTDSQSAVIEALLQFRESKNACLGFLSRKLSLDMETVTQQAPVWLAEMARDVFFENATLTPSEMTLLREHQFPTKVEVFGTGRAAIQAALANLNPAELQLSAPPKFIHITRFNVRKKNGIKTLSVKISFIFAGEEQQHVFEIGETPVGAMEPEQVLAEHVLTLFRHRIVFSSELNFRREANVLRYNILRLIPVARIEYLPQLQRLAHLLQGFEEFRGNRLFFNKLYLSYMKIRTEIVDMAEKAQKQLDLHAQFSTSTAQGRWNSHPQYLRTHPWFYGTSETSLLAPLNLFEALVDPRRSHPKTLVFLSPQPFDMTQFNDPVDPQ